MNRKLHNTFAALIASSVLMLGLFAAAPVSLQTGAAQAHQVSARQSTTGTGKANAVNATLEPALAARLEAVTLQLPRRPGHVEALDAGSEPALVTSIASTLEDTAAAPAALQKTRYKSGKSRRIRQSMAMPFFSFAPRG